MSCLGIELGALALEFTIASAVIGARTTVFIVIVSIGFPLSLKEILNKEANCENKSFKERRNT